MTEIFQEPTISRKTYAKSEEREVTNARFPFKMTNALHRKSELRQKMCPMQGTWRSTYNQQYWRLWEVQERQNP